MIDLPILDASDILKFDRGRISFVDTIEEAVLNIDSEDYSMEEFSHKGGNSKLFKLYLPQESQEKPHLILKICRYKLPNRESEYKKIHKRFIREVEALIKCNVENFNDVISITNKGVLSINKKKFLFYIMEYAELDLKEHLKNAQIDVSAKIELCIEIAYSGDIDPPIRPY